MNTPASQNIVLQNHKDVLIYQFRLLETMAPQERSTVLNYLTMAWMLTTESTQPLDPYNVQHRYYMRSQVTTELYSFLVQMDPIQNAVLSIQFEGVVSAVAA